MYLLNYSFLSFISLIIGLLIGITIHEFTHAWVAFKFGDPTPYHAKRVSLNPFVHLDPLGTIFLFLVGFGWGRPVPINPFYLSKFEEVIVALSGPFSNLALAFFLTLPLRFGLALPLPLLEILNFVIFINIFLCIFNLLPIPPLDGSKLLKAFLPEDLAQQFESFGIFLLILLVLFDNVIPIFSFAAKIAFRIYTIFRGF